MSNKNITFWQLINEHRIEIPIIQRDYAQGRDNSKSEDIRIRFIEQIKKTLLDDGDELHLNFVYGKINGVKNARKIAENKSAIQGMLNAVQSYSKNMNLNVICEIKENDNLTDGTHQTSFIPLDGQQRLTTLYLVHWYLMPFTIDNIKTIKNFSYRIRSSSKDFCFALSENQNEINKSKPISKQIDDAPWFFSYWKNDPTVKGMLTMLDEIYNQFGDEKDLTSYWNCLTQENKINFEFLDLDDYNLTDELYVKMNARGKPLTSFENFKAWLMELVERKEKENNKKYIEIEDWKDFLDTKWADLFWEYKDDQNMLIDEEYIRFFRNMAQIFCVQNEDFKPDGKTDEEKLLRDMVVLFTDKGLDGEYKYIPNNYFEELKVFFKNDIERPLTLSVFTKKGWNETFSIINLLSDNGIGMKIIEEDLSFIKFFNTKNKTLFESFISGTMTYPDKVRFYGLAIYLIKSQKGLYNATSIKSWMRIVRNLVQNSLIEDISSFSRAIRGLDKLSENCNNIIDFIAKGGEISGFNKEQILEEIKKGKIIYNARLNQNEEWEEVLLDAENHPLFKGKIDFLLTENYELIDFILRKNCAKEIFYNKHRENYLITRAVLAKSEICENISLKNTEANWLILLDNFKIQNAVNKVITDLILKTDYEEALKQIIFNYDDKSVLWRYYLTKCENLLNSNYSQTKKIQLYGKNVFLYNKETWNNNDNQFLLSNYRNELITLFLKKNDGYINESENWNHLKCNQTDLSFYRGWRINLKKDIGQITFNINDEYFMLDNAIFTIEFSPDKIYFGLKFNSNKIKKLEEHSKQNFDWLVVREFIDSNNIYNSEIEKNQNSIELAISKFLMELKPVLIN